MLSEFKSFIMKGNVMDLAVGVIIGGAFATIVKSLTNDIIMPIVGMIFGGLDFSEFFLSLSSDVTANTLEAAREQGAVLAYGSFITATVNFVILGFIIFMMVKTLNRIMAKEEKTPKEPPAPAAEVVLLGEIRDLLKSQKQVK
ncbi:MAG: large conductance mechanosensitive channel protein MscL [Hyphomicrobiales bacterium]|nr:large conductance mechanosensitive channel protein MscL [Hyphomicrobiales bacterium]